MNIAIIGAEINNPNLGCQALAWSAIGMINNICEDINILPEYYIIEGKPDSDKVENLCNKLNIPVQRIHVIKMGIQNDIFRQLKNIKEVIECNKCIKKADILINFTLGDSFSDLYGTRILDTIGKYILFSKKNDVPVILGPQTYGPFTNNKNIRFAIKVLKSSDVIMARDEISAKMVKKLTNRDVIVTNDIAFSLCSGKEFIESDKIKIGINISGLLSDENKNTYNSKFDVSRKYRNYIYSLVKTLLETRLYEIFLIPHVKSDCEQLDFINDFRKDVTIYDLFEDPTHAKGIISQMDVFIGSRMHATIAAISTGVVTIPVSYSRKFKGLFDLIDYDVSLDINELSEEELLMHTMDIICRLDEYKEKVRHSMGVSMQLSNLLYDSLKNYIINL